MAKLIIRKLIAIAYSDRTGCRELQRFEVKGTPDQYDDGRFYEAVQEHMDDNGWTCPIANIADEQDASEVEAIFNLKPKAAVKLRA